MFIILVTSARYMPVHWTSARRCLPLFLQDCGMLRTLQQTSDSDLSRTTTDTSLDIHGKDVPIHAVGSRRGSRGTAPLIYTVDTGICVGEHSSQVHLQPAQIQRHTVWAAQPVWTFRRILILNITWICNTYYDAKKNDVNLLVWSLHWHWR